MQFIKQYKNALSALGLGLLSIILSSLMLYNGHNWGGDFSEYIAQAIALTQGKEAILTQVKNNTFIIDNCDWLFGPYIYPWGYPLLLAPIYALFGENLIALKMINVIAFGIFVGVFFRFCARHLSYKLALLAAALFALNPMLLGFNNNILSDTTFLLFSFLSVIMLSRLFFAPNTINTINANASAPESSAKNKLESIVPNKLESIAKNFAKNALDSSALSINITPPPPTHTYIYKHNRTHA